MSGLVGFDGPVANLPKTGDIYLGYADESGIGETYPAVVVEFPRARHISISTRADVDADMLDVEKGAASPTDIPGWIDRHSPRSLSRPCIYFSASIYNTVMTYCQRVEVFLFSAHDTHLTPLGAHTCAPHVCGYGEVDWTQWAQNVPPGYDQSLCNPYVFSETSPGPVAPPNPSHPPLPKEITNMVIGTNPHTSNLIIVGNATDNGDLLVFELINGKWTVMDVTEAIGTSPRAYKVS